MAHIRFKRCSLGWQKNLMYQSWTEGGGLTFLQGEFTHNSINYTMLFTVFITRFFAKLRSDVTSSFPISMTSIYHTQTRMACDAAQSGEEAYYCKRPSSSKKFVTTYGLNVGF